MYWPTTPSTKTKYSHVPLPIHAGITHFSFTTNQQNPHTITCLLVPQTSYQYIILD